MHLPRFFRRYHHRRRLGNALPAHEYQGGIPWKKITALHQGNITPALEIEEERKLPRRLRPLLLLACMPRLPRRSLRLLKGNREARYFCRRSPMLAGSVFLIFYVLGLTKISATH
jgi:hypothetical protein